MNLGLTWQALSYWIRKLRSFLMTLSNLAWPWTLDPLPLPPEGWDHRHSPSCLLVHSAGNWSQGLEHGSQTPSPRSYHQAYSSVPLLSGSLLGCGPLISSPHGVDSWNDQGTSIHSDLRDALLPCACNNMWVGFVRLACGGLCYSTVRLFPLKLRHKKTRRGVLNMPWLSFERNRWAWRWFASRTLQEGASLPAQPSQGTTGSKMPGKDEKWQQSEERGHQVGTVQRPRSCEPLSPRVLCSLICSWGHHEGISPIFFENPPRGTVRSRARQLLVDKKLSCGAALWESHEKARGSSAETLTWLCRTHRASSEA